MKKFLALMLALVMVFALAACGDAGTEPTEAPEGSAAPHRSPRRRHYGARGRARHR